MAQWPEGQSAIGRPIAVQAFHADPERHNDWTVKIPAACIAKIKAERKLVGAALGNGRQLARAITSRNAHQCIQYQSNFDADLAHVALKRGHARLGYLHPSLFSPGEVRWWSGWYHSNWGCCPPMIFERRIQGRGWPCCIYKHSLCGWSVRWRSTLFIGWSCQPWIVRRCPKCWKKTIFAWVF